MSVGQKQFSLNGGYRNQGFVGQTSLSRSLPRTPMKGNVPKGNGGCCGAFPKNHIIQSAVTSLNVPSVIKHSVLSNRGYIHTQYRWILRPQPYSVFKTPGTDFSTYVDKLHDTTVKCANASSVNGNSGVVNSGCKGLVPIQRPKVCVFITKNLLNPETIEDRYVACQDTKQRMKNNANIPIVGGIHS